MANKYKAALRVAEKKIKKLKRVVQELSTQLNSKPAPKVEAPKEAPKPKVEAPKAEATKPAPKPKTTVKKTVKKTVKRATKPRKA